MLCIRGMESRLTDLTLEAWINMNHHIILSRNLHIAKAYKQSFFTLTWKFNVIQIGCL